MALYKKAKHVGTNTNSVQKIQYSTSARNKTPCRIVNNAESSITQRRAYFGGKSIKTKQDNEKVQRDEPAKEKRRV